MAQELATPLEQQYVATQAELGDVRARLPLIGAHLVHLHVHVGCYCFVASGEL